MKPLYSRFCSALATFVLIISLNSSVKAQTTLVAGDLAFSGYKCNDAVPDQFSFVLLKAITATTVIRFSDYGWRTNVAPGPQFINNGGAILESELVYTNTTGSTIPAGREITIVGTAATFTNGASAGSVVFTVGAQFLVVSNISLASNGDQIFAYQGSFAVPVFIAGIHMNVYTGVPSTTTAAAWDGVLAAASQDNNNSELPAGLTTGTNANWFATEQDNVRFICGAAPTSTAPQCLTALNTANTNPGFWTANNTNPSGFTLPTGCAYILPPLAVNIERFTGKLNADKTITLQWKVAAQQDIQQYIVEESTDGITYRQSGTVAAGNGTTENYSFIDLQVAAGNNYYRLKTVELSGKISYSNVVLINLKAGIKVNLYPNPVTDKLTIQQFGSIQNKTAVLSDGRGNILQQIKLTSQQQTVNMETYPSGVYILKMEDGTVFKVVKQ